MSSKGKDKSKGKTTKKGKTVTKIKSKAKSKISKAERTEALASMMDLQPKSVRKDLSSYFAKVAKARKPVKKKLTRKQIIKNYQRHKEDIADFEQDRQRQWELRHSTKVMSQAAYSDWLRDIPNAREYPEKVGLFFKNWEETKKDDKPLEVEQGGDGRLTKFRRSRNSDYQTALTNIPKMEGKYSYLPLEAEIKEVTGLTKTEIAKEINVGVPTGYLTKDAQGRDIEETHLFNYPPSAIPVYKNPVLAELAKNDDSDEVTVSYSRWDNKIRFEHLRFDRERWRRFVDIMEKSGYDYSEWRMEGNKEYNEANTAKVIKELRENGYQVQIHPTVTIPEPIRLIDPKGDERFDVLLNVDRTSFAVNVTGRKRARFLKEIDSRTAVPLKDRDAKLAFLKQHPDTKIPIREYKKELQAKGVKLTTEKGENKVDTWIMKNLKYILPADEQWHFVDRKKETIPIGFVYHFVLDMENYNVKITDNRPLYLDIRAPVMPSKIDPVTGEIFELRPYQEQAVESAIDKKSGIVAAATGSGKTEIGAFIIAGQGLDAVWFAHRGELIRQAEERIERRIGMDVGAYGGDSKEIISTPEMDVNVMTVQSASEIMRTPRVELKNEVNKWNKEIKLINNKINRESNSQKKLHLEKSKDVLQEKHTKARMKLEVYDFVSNASVQIFDESHHLTSLQFGDIARATPQARYRYGLSATPWGNDAADQKRIESLMGRSVAEITATELINKGYLAKPNIYFADIPHVIEYPLAVIGKNGEIKKVAYGDDDLTYPELNKAAVVRSDRFNDHVADFTAECQEDGLNTMILVNEVEHGNLIQRKLRMRGIDADFLNAKETIASDQRVILDRFKAGEKDTLVATIGKAGEGVDIPALDVVILAHGGKSLVQTMQRIGRAMRIPKDSDKKECLIIDFARKEKHLGWHPSKKSHSDERRRIYTIEPAFDVSDVDIDELDDEISRIARLNKAKKRKEREPISVFERPEKFRTRKERQEYRELSRDIERLERGLPVEVLERGVGEDAKRVYRSLPKFRDRRMSTFEIQAIINKKKAKGIAWDVIDWDKLDSSLEVGEAIQAAKL